MIVPSNAISLPISFVESAATLVTWHETVPRDSAAAIPETRFLVVSTANKDVLVVVTMSIENMRYVSVVLRLYRAPD